MKYFLEKTKLKLEKDLQIVVLFDKNNKKKFNIILRNHISFEILYIFLKN